jgi:hypothetical protein
MLGMIARLLPRRRARVQSLVQLGDQRLIRGYGGNNYDGYNYQS